MEKITIDIIISMELSALSKFSTIIAPHLSDNEMIIKNSMIDASNSIYTVNMEISELILDLLLYKLTEINDVIREII